MELINSVPGLRHFLETVLLAVAALLPIIDPLGGAPIYLAMTADLSDEQRRAMVKSVAVNSFLLLLASTLIGAYVLDFFSLSIPAVQIAGGLIVCATAWSLLNKPNALPELERTAVPAEPIHDLRERAFYPLTMPLTVGPGAISVALTLGANPARGARSHIVTAVAHALGILIVAMSIYGCNRYAQPISTRLGATGTGVLMRLSAFILLCIGVQICGNGLRTLLSVGFIHPVP